MLMRKREVLYALFLGLGLQSASADSGYSLGAEYSEGDYGTGVTSRAWYIPFAWRYGNDDIRASVTVPYLIIEGSSLVTFDGRRISPSGMGMGGGGSGGTSSTTRTESGLGDIMLSGSYLLLSEADTRPWVAATAKVKLGTADENKGLGTGENDYAVQLDAGKGVLYGYAGYRVLGDTAAVDYNDVSFIGAELSFPMGKSNTFGIKYYTEQASLDGMDDVREASLSLGGEVSKEMDYSIYYVAGLTDSSADSVIGISLSSRLK